jgi:malonyl-CoA decarboxylase
VPTEEQIREFIETRKDPVARFHLGNGARLQSVNFDADRSSKRLEESWGIMVNYNYS